MEKQVFNSVEQINDRIDKVLAANRRSEALVFAIAGFILLWEMVIFVVGYWHGNVPLPAGALLLPGPFYSIRKIIYLRNVNLTLQTFPIIISALSEKDSAEEIRKILDYLQKLRT